MVSTVGRRIDPDRRGRYGRRQPFRRRRSLVENVRSLLLYVNSIPTSITDSRQASQLLFKDALAQADAENASWPYAWFKLGGYVPESGRGTVTGKLAIADSGNPILRSATFGWGWSNNRRA